MTQVDNLPGEEIEFSIGDPRWVMKTQADLYSNRELAVTREYSTNGYDANKEYARKHGTEVAPIHVTLPSPMRPYFIVQDFGLGMTREVLAEVYTKFGTSTKRGSNDYNGMLGYGSKSAVAYSSQFTVESIAQGRKHVAVITRKPDWSITMKIVSSAATDEPSGTKITVPVHNAQEFAHKAMDFYKFWQPGTVLINGEEPEFNVGELVTDGFYTSNSSTSYVVMGNVPYRIENPQALFWDTKMSFVNFVAYVDNGDVEFTPSREDLMYTDLTKNTLKKVINEFSDKIVKVAKDEIAKAKTHAEAYTLWKKWTAKLGKSLFDDLTFKGDAFNDSFPVPGYRWDTRGYRGYSYNVSAWEVSEAHRTIVVTGITPGLTINSSHKQKVKEFCQIKGINLPIYVLFVRADKINSVWYPTDKTYSWEHIKDSIPKKPRTASGGGATKDVKGSFDFITYNGTKREQIIPDTYKASKFFYITPGDIRDNYSPQTIIQHLPKDMQDITVVVVYANRLNKFKRDYPLIKEFVPWAKKQVITNASALLSKETKEIMSVEYYDKNWLTKLNPARLDDPEVIRYIGLAKGTPDKAEYDRNRTLAYQLHMGSSLKEWEPQREKYVLKQYPLLSSLSYYNIPADVYVYMNAKYAAMEAARKDKND